MTAGTAYPMQFVPDVWGHILTFLDFKQASRLALTSKSGPASVWQPLRKLPPLPANPSHPSFVQHVINNPHLINISEFDAENFPEKLADAIIAKNPSINYLRLSLSEVSPQGLSIGITRIGSNLLKLNLSWWRKGEDSIDEVLCLVAKHCPNLKWLMFDAKVSESSIVALMEHCKELVEIYGVHEDYLRLPAVESHPKLKVIGGRVVAKLTDDSYGLLPPRRFGSSDSSSNTSNDPQLVEQCKEAVANFKSSFPPQLQLNNMLIFESVRGKENARPLLFSALGRDTASPAIVNYLLSPEVGCDVNRPDSLRKLTALQYAIQANVSNEVISILLQHGADPTMRDGTGKSAFLSVVKSSNASTMKLLYGEPLIQALQAHGRHASGRFLLTQDGMDPIMTALKANELQNAEWLLDRFIDLGIPFNTTTSYGLTALHLACNIAAPVAFLEKLVKSGNFDINAKDNLGRIPLCHSMRRMDNMTVDFFRKRNCELDPQMPTTTGSTMIIEACRMGHYLLFIELLKKLKLEDIMKPTWKGMSLFHAACGSKCSDFLQAIFNHIKKMAVTYNEDVDDLTKRFIDPNKSLDDGQSPLYLAAGKPMSVKALLRLGAKFTNDVKFDPLTAAALNCDYQSTSLMINAGANVNIGVEQGMPTPLFVACHTNMDSPGGNLSAKVVSLLMKAGVIHDNNGHSWLPVHVAIKQRKSSVLKLLLPVTDMSKRVPGSGQTMLILAAETGHLETLEVVLDQLDEKGLLAQTINLKDSDGHTALIHAAHSPISDSDLAQFVSLLVSAGADLNAKDRKQKTASDIAQDRGRAETARLLRGEVPPMPRQVDCDDDDD